MLEYLAYSLHAMLIAPTLSGNYKENRGEIKNNELKPNTESTENN